MTMVYLIPLNPRRIMITAFMMQFPQKLKKDIIVLTRIAGTAILKGDIRTAFPRVQK